MTDRPPISGEPSTALQRLLDYSWGLHLAGTPNEAEAIGLIEAARAEAHATPPLLDTERLAMAAWTVLRTVTVEQAIAIAAEYARLTSKEERP